MYGTSKEYSRVDVNYVLGTAYGSMPLMDILDNNYLGWVGASFYQQTGAIRRYNNQAFLNRNYAIKTDSTPPGANIDMNLYFTTQEFDALKATDNTIIDPGYLTVIRQPGTSANAPATYTPVAGEEVLAVNSWDAETEGGYRIQLTANGFGNFFIKKLAPVSLCSGAASTSFTSNKTGVTYAWAVNNGTGFTAVANDANYSGVNTATLTIVNIPASFNGNLYRCVINSITLSNSFLLQVANLWTDGTNDHKWETPGNWSCNKVPDATTDVIINSGTATINSAGAVCRSIKLRVPANLSVLPGFKLVVVH
jgi:hypothetical protein